MDYNDIKQLIDDNIKPNTSQDITAIVANLVMTAMIDYTRDSIIDIVNQGFGAGAFTWLDVEHGAVIPYPQMSAGRARVVRIFKDNVEYAEGEATIGGVNGITIKRHALVICLEATNEMANDGMQETVGDRFAVINQSDVDDNFLPLQTVTKSELDNLIANEELIPNALYEITGVHPALYGGTTIYLQAISRTELNPNGIGKFYNPKYDQTKQGFGIAVDYVFWANVGDQKPSGVYDVDDVVIWGGKHWTCIQPTTTSTKYIVDTFNLDTDYFEEIPFNETYYNVAYDAIKYDYENDWIVERNEKNSNIVSFDYEWLKSFECDYSWIGNCSNDPNDLIQVDPIKNFQWGNTYSPEDYVGIGFQRITNSVNQNINFRGSYQYNLTFDNSSYQNNLTFDNNSYQYNLTFDNGSRQNSLTFDNSSYQYNLTFDNGSRQNNLTFDNSSYQYNLTFDNGSRQNSLTSSGSNRRQQRITFNGFQSNRTGQPLNSNEDNLTFDNTVQNLPRYGQGNVTGTPAYILGVTSDGKVVEIDGNSLPYDVVRGKGFIGRSITEIVGGSYRIDFNDMAEHYILTMSDNTSIAFENMITEDETVVITLTITGNYSLLLPSFLKPSPDNDSYDGDLNNEIVINIKRGGANPLGYYTLKNYEI